MSLAGCLFPAAAPTTGQLGHTSSADARSLPTFGGYIKGEREGSPSGSRGDAISEGKAASVIPRNRRPESWAPWEDVRLGNYKPIQVRVSPGASGGGGGRPCSHLLALLII